MTEAIDYVSDDVISAILAGTTTVTRRVAIFEGDGSTPWRDDLELRIVDGNVSISGDGDTRRALDLTLDNDEGFLVLDPDNGLWYDKIIKVYRGVEYVSSPDPNQPRLLIVNGLQTDAVNIRKYLNGYGYTDVDYLSVDEGVDPNLIVAAMSRYDVAVAWAFNADLSVAAQGVVNMLYNQALPTFTITNRASATTTPISALHYYQEASTPGATMSAQLVASDTPMSGLSIPSTQIYFYKNDNVPLNDGSSDQFEFTSNFQNHNCFAMSYNRDNPTFGRHIQFYFAVPDPAVDSGWRNQFRVLLDRVIGYLAQYKSVTNYYETQLGEFMIDTLTQPRFPKQIKLTGRDYSKKLVSAKFSAATSYPSGTNLMVTIRGLLQDAGITKFKFSSSVSSLQSVLQCDAGSTYSEAISKLSESCNFDYYFDRYGYFVVKDFVDPSSSPVTFKVKAGGTDGNLIDYVKSSNDSEIFNYIVVIGESAAGSADGTPPPTSGPVINNLDGSPTSVQRIGKRVYYYSSTAFTTNAQCLDWANRLLSIMGLEQYQLEFSTVVFPWIDVNEIMEFTDPDDPDDEFPTRMLFTDGSIPLQLSSMSGTGKRVTVVGQQ